VIPAKYGRWRNIYLIIVSYLLYINWKPAYALILFGVTAVTYFCARSFEVVKKPKVVLLGGALLALLPLLVFKYYNFINDSVFEFLSSIGLSFKLPGLNWAIPMGISFFTFQALGYLFDVYHKRITAERDFLTYALFISFFPSIVAGPINKASLVIPQLKALRPTFDYSKAVEGLKMLLWGMFMKVVVADRVALYVDTVFPNYMNYTGLTCFAASIFYTIQIYADFAGYSLMALGVGKVLGFELTENFRRPYFAVSVTDFWRRWHISLSTWLKDYVYIPLGGSRCSKVRNYWNIFITFLVSGIWHGANWTFIVWGCMHGFCQIVEKALGLQKLESSSVWVRAGRILLTFLIVNFAWIFFRMPSLSDAVSVIARIFDPHLPLTLYIPALPTPPLIVIGCALLFAKDFRDEFFPGKILLMNNGRQIVRWCTYVCLIVSILLMGVFSSDQFIYANF
jgi:D-alanyl-lipoteichoic acid acyltransferase DltB (MBOAT superfamily)